MTDPAWLRTVEGGVEIALYVSPRASRTRVVGEHDGRLKLQVAAPPVDGKANDEISQFVAELLAVPRSAVRIGAGATGKRKSVVVDGVDAATVVARVS